MILLTGGCLLPGTVCSWGCFLPGVSALGGASSRGVSTPRWGGVCSRVDVCSQGGASVLPPGGPVGEPPGMATAARGTHPTGVHSCKFSVRLWDFAYGKL